MLRFYLFCLELNWGNPYRYLWLRGELAGLKEKNERKLNTVGVRRNPDEKQQLITPNNNKCINVRWIHKFYKNYTIGT